MTEYEQLVNDGFISPMNSMDWLILQSTLDSLIKGDEQLDAELKSTLDNMIFEIEHIYSGDIESLTKIKNILYND